MLFYAQRIHIFGTRSKKCPCFTKALGMQSSYPPQMPDLCDVEEIGKQEFDFQWHLMLIIAKCCIIINVLFCIF